MPHIFLTLTYHVTDSFMRINERMSKIGVSIFLIPGSCHIYVQVVGLVLESVLLSSDFFRAVLKNIVQLCF